MSLQFAMIVELEFERLQTITEKSRLRDSDSVQNSRLELGYVCPLKYGC